ncbi:DUF350 domain-containing protein [bacterium]|nr:MAG: DUF350 domain-containing protein [bacterium]
MDLYVDWSSLARNAAYVGLSVLFILIAKLVADLMTRYDDDLEVRERANGALALRRAGMYLGLAIGLASSLSQPGVSFPSDLLAFAQDGALLIAVLLIAQVVNEKVMLRGLRTHEAIRENNLAVGAVEFGQFVATGLIFAGAILGEGNHRSSILFAVLGQVGLLLAFELYGRFARWNVRAEIGGGNVAAGVLLGGRLLALGVIVNNSVAGDSSTLAKDLLSFGVYYVYGLILLAGVTWLADLVFLPKARLHEMIEKRNVPAVALLSAITLAVAIVVWASS